MKKNTKGFTLIELLAVIVILAIIALIATPIVLNLINKARQGAAQDSAYGVRKAAQLYYQASLVENIDGFAKTTITFNGDGDYTGAVEGSSTTLDKAALNTKGFNIDGTVPAEGVIVIETDGTVHSVYEPTNSPLKINGWYCPVNPSGKVECASSKS